MGLLPVTTVFEQEKRRTRVSGRFAKVGGALAEMSGVCYEGYEIHMGQTVYCDGDGSGAKGRADKAARSENSAESNRSAFCADDAMRNTKITEKCSQ